MSHERIRLTFPTSYNSSAGNKIQVIKALRSLTGSCLLDAKNACEDPANQEFIVLPSLSTQEISAQLQILTSNGVKVSNPVFQLLNQLRELAREALSLNEDELANEILQLVLIEKLRREESHII